MISLEGGRLLLLSLLFVVASSSAPSFDEDGDDYDDDRALKISYDDVAFPILCVLVSQLFFNFLVVCALYAISRTLQRCEKCEPKQQPEKKNE